MVDPHTRPTPHPSVVGRIIDDEAVLVLPEQGEVKVLNEVGARIWQLIDGSRTVEEIADVIYSEYEVDEEQARSDVLAFIVELESKGIVAA